MSTSNLSPTPDRRTVIARAILDGTVRGLETGIAWEDAVPEFQESFLGVADYVIEALDAAAPAPAPAGLSVGEHELTTADKERMAAGMNTAMMLAGGHPDEIVEWFLSGLAESGYVIVRSPGGLSAGEVEARRSVVVESINGARVWVRDDTGYASIQTIEDDAAIHLADVILRSIVARSRP